MMIWKDVSELKSDVRQLLVESGVNKVEIQNLKTNVQMLNSQVFKTAAAPNTKNKNSRSTTVYIPLLFKHENIYDTSAYLLHLAQEMKFKTKLL
jgi:two-component SAPR family response regulator